METSYALVDSSNIVINIVNWNGQPPWQPDEGSQAVIVPDDQLVDIGWTYLDGEFIAPPQTDLESAVEG